MTLPENIDASYLDQSPGDAAHQGHHDEIHQKVNRIPTGTSPVLTEATGNAAYEAKQTEEGFRAYRSTLQAIANATVTTIVFDTEVRDQGADHNPASGGWTVPATGWYDVATSIYFLGLAAGDRVWVSLYVNGVESTRLHDISVGAAGIAMVGGARPMYLTAGDGVNVRVWRTSVGDVGAGAEYTYFTAKRRYVA